MGDRLSQTVGAATTHYALDAAAGLTQVLADGTNTYLYGNDRLAQYQASMQYFGADGLGSVRQIYDASGVVVGSTRYDPFGNVMSQGGTATSVFAFAGEQYDAATSYNAWLYAYADAVNLTDPSGRVPIAPPNAPGSDCNSLLDFCDELKKSSLPVIPSLGDLCDWILSHISPATPSLGGSTPTGTPKVAQYVTLTPAPTQTATATPTPTLGPRPTATRQDLNNVAIIATFEGQVLAEGPFGEDVYRAIAWTVRNRVATRHEGVTGYSDPNLLAKYDAYEEHKQPRSSAVIAVWKVLFAESTASDLTHGVRYFVGADYWLKMGYRVDQVVKFNSPQIVLRYDYQAAGGFYGLYFFANWPPPLPPRTP